MDDRVGRQVGNYRLVRLLGRGGFAEVYLGEHVHLGTQAAIKLLSGSLATPEEVARFRQEARMVAALIHPHIVRVLEFGVEDGQPYLVVDYAPGGTLRERHPPGTPVPLATVVPYVQQIAQGLQYAHDHQIIHRDIKPQNLLLGRAGEVLLSDFGISIVVESTTRQHTLGFAGTAAYAAPEQVQGHPRPASDQYSLGMIVYEWLTGTLPFTGAILEVMWKQAHNPPPPLRDKVPTIPPAVEEVILTALAKDPRERFGSVQAFANALQGSSSTPNIQAMAAPYPIIRPPAPPPAVLHPITPPAGPQPGAPPLPESGQPGMLGASGQFPTPARISAPGFINPPASPMGREPTRPPSAPIPAAPGMQGAQTDRRRSKVFVSLLIAGLLAVLLVGGISVIFAGGHQGTQANGQPTATSTPMFTPTPTFTPTFTPTPNPFAPYSATVPGPGCDNGGGQWFVSNQPMVSCSSNGMKLSQPPNQTAIAEVFFNGPRSGYVFPRNYSISVYASDLSAYSNTCVGFTTRRTGPPGYGLFVCRNGFWKIIRYDSSGNPKEITNGNVTASSSYHLQVVSNGSSEGIAINGVGLMSINDSSYMSTDFISLALDTGVKGPAGSAVFSNFVFTPMP